MKKSVAAIVEYQVRSAHAAEFPQIIRDKWLYQEQAGYIVPGTRLARLERDVPVYMEVFSWADSEAIERAHQDAAMLAVWDRLDDVTEGGRWEGIRIENGEWV
ncbi:MAG: hypothetical protein M1272_07355 [Firmicutes bacterium]|nr:hypothetical protein [Bacillota bacterium]